MVYRPSSYLKEGSGNLGTAILLVIPALDYGKGRIGPVLLIVFAAVLIATHFTHARRQAEHELHFLWHTDDEDRKKVLEDMAGRLNIKLK